MHSASFNSVADQYRAVRPGYPPELFDFVVNTSGIGIDSKFLEIGCGTGQATAGFASRGYEILGLEPGLALAKRARQELSHYRRVRVEQETFESWAPSNQRFSLLFSAHAYHWIEPQASVNKPHTVLEENGTVALIWNLPVEESSALRSALNLAYEQHAPALARGRSEFDPMPSLRVRSEAVALRLVSSPLYISLAKQSFLWVRTYAAEDYVRLLGTYSDHLALKPEERVHLFGAVAEAIHNAGGRIDMKYETVCYLLRCQQWQQ